MHKLVFTDERDLITYESMPANDFKEFFMAYFKYKKGDKIEITDFTNPVTFALFNSYIPKLDKNEETYSKKVNANRENGKKGGRPRKNVENQNKPVLAPQNELDDNLYQPEVEMLSNGLKTAKNTEFEVGLTPSPINQIEEVEFDNYEEVVYELLESEDGGIIRNILERAIDYLKFNKEEYKQFAEYGNKKITDILIQHNITTGKARKDFEKWVCEFNESYLKSTTVNNINEYAA